MQRFLLQVDVSKIIVEEGDEPGVVVDLLDADLLTGEDGAEVHLVPLVADAATGGDDDGFVMERIVELGKSVISSF